MFLSSSSSSCPFTHTSCYVPQVETLTALTRTMVSQHTHTHTHTHNNDLPSLSCAAGVLIIWDRIFGTFQPEREKVIYGLVHPLGTWDPFWAQVGISSGFSCAHLPTQAVVSSLASICRSIIMCISGSEFGRRRACATNCPSSSRDLDGHRGNHDWALLVISLR